MGSRERIALRLVLWIVQRYLVNKYRLMTPEELNQVVDNYLAELPKLGIHLEYRPSNVGESYDQVTAYGSSVVKEDKPPRQSRRRKPAAMEAEKPL